MVKTQESVLKQRIRLTLILFFFFDGMPCVHAYSIQAPLENEQGPRAGQTIQPRASFQTQAETADFNLDLNAAMNADFSLSGRYSLRNDHRMGLSLGLYDQSGTELRAQFEVLLDKSSRFALAPSLFGKTQVYVSGFPSLTLEGGGAIHYEIENERAALPFSLLIGHEPESAGLLYGGGFQGALSPSDDQNWTAFHLKVGLQARSGAHYILRSSLPLTELASDHGASVSFGISIPLGDRHQQADSSFKAPSWSSPTENPHYDLNAKVVSMNEALFLLKINKGSRDSVAKGQTFDIYHEDALLARAQVLSVKNDEAALNVVEYKQEHWIELGFSACRLTEE